MPSRRQSYPDVSSRRPDSHLKKQPESEVRLRVAADLSSRPRSAHRPQGPAFHTMRLSYFQIILAHYLTGGWPMLSPQKSGCPVLLAFWKTRKTRGQTGRSPILATRTENVPSVSDFPPRFSFPRDSFPRFFSSHLIFSTCHLRSLR